MQNRRMTTVPNAEAPLQSNDEIKETTLQRKTGRLTIKHRVRGHIVRMRVKENDKENNEIKAVRYAETGQVDAARTNDPHSDNQQQP